jgi:hypothetical protein
LPDKLALDEPVFFDYIYYMAIRGEVFSTKVLLARRTYFFNVKENRLGDLYLNIVESKKDDEGTFERQSLIVFDEDKAAFLKGLDDALRVLNRESANKRGAASGRPTSKNGGARKAYSKKSREDDD